jgi:predicted O-linked N-acetylglucosamine transferase (SPINDLY family)
VTRLVPDSPRAHLNLGFALKEQKQFAAAIACFRRALQINPLDALTLSNLGTVHFEQGELAEANECFRQALGVDPQFVAAHYNLGRVLQQQGRLAEATQHYQDAARIQPDFALAHYNLGIVLQEQGRPAEAARCYREALRSTPDFALAHGNLGSALILQGRFAEAENCLRHALRLDPRFALAHHNLAIALQEQGRLVEATRCFRDALALDPNHADTHYYLGNALVKQGELAEAITCYERALQLKPHDLTYQISLIHQRQHACDWHGLANLTRQVIETVETGGAPASGGGVPPFAFLTLHTPTTPRQQLLCARRKSSGYAQLQGRRPALPPRGARSHITLGYLSADFYDHPTTSLIAELFEQHDRGKFRVHGYSLGPDDRSAIRQRLARGFDQFVDLQHTSFQDAAQRIADDGVDILIDLNGHAGDARPPILVLRPAPIQVHYLGYPGTTGAPYLDYILVDDFIVPPDQQPFFTEQLVHLPGCYQINDRQRQIAADTPQRSNCGLPAEGFVFCNFNNSYKITPALFAVWMNLLKAVPGSVLWLLEANAPAAANLRREAEARGVDAQRLVFAPKRPGAEHLARHRLADLFLDTFAVNAHTTASDALWAGCPVLTLAGETFVSRVAGSLLRAVGLPELVTTSCADYEALALHLARNTQVLADLRTRLEANLARTPLFDSTLFARNLEKVFTVMVEKHATASRRHA